MEQLKLHTHNIRKATRQLIEKKTMGQAVLTDDQLMVIDEIARWFAGEYKQQSGVLLLGNVGVGKTTIMQAVVAYYCFRHNKTIGEYHAKQLPVEYVSKGLEYFYKRPIFVDDLGKEPPITTIWGQKYDTWADIFSIRYENRALTFATANYNHESFSELYGNVVADRMKEHFNTFVLKGESLRK
jgi:DNA replication protein DnaC